ncbi:MAG: hypothetical protein LBQ71_17630 [Hungatella sp.]|nr:hypothetical protein [Hungatella sp.]
MLQAKENTKQARLVLVDLAQSMILDTCSLLGMLCPDKKQTLATKCCGFRAVSEQRPG